MTETAEITCPSCEECGWFTLHKTAAGYSARCQNCQHEFGVPGVTVLTSGNVELP